MSEPEKLSAAEQLEKDLVFRVLDDEDFRMARFHFALHSEPSRYWLVLNSDDDERYQRPIRCGQWPPEIEVIVKQLWRHCVTLAAKSEEQRKRHGKLSVAAGAVILGSFMIPLLLPSSRGERGPIQHALAR